jgi:Ca2+-binding RTX toxin-like protein
LSGAHGNDVLLGGRGNDRLVGGEDNDVLLGEQDNDTLFGSSGDDDLQGGSGDDTYRFVVLEGNDTLTEGSVGGINTLDFSFFAQGVTVRLDQSVAVQQAGLTLTILNYAPQNVIGSRYNDTIVGNDSANTFWGGDGNDTLTGMGGTDYLYGQGDNDTLSADAVDQLFGGGGQDWFGGWLESGWMPNPRTGLFRDWGRGF